MRTRNFDSERTATSYWGRGQYLPFELFSLYGSGHRTSWNRYFFNEKKHVSVAEFARYYLNVGSPVGDKKVNLWDSDQRITFEREVQWQHKLYPGLYAPEGEKVDVENLISIWQQQNPKDTFVETLTDEDICQGIHTSIDNKPWLFKEYEDVCEPAEEATGKNTVGIQLPQYLNKKEGKTLL